MTLLKSMIEKVIPTFIDNLHVNEFSAGAAMSTTLIFIIFFFIALCYSSVGFGGGSSYIAFLSLLLTDFYEIRTMGLMLNLVVVAMGSWAHYKKGYIDGKSFLPFVSLSLIFAFLGARFRLHENTFFVILGLSLLISSFFMMLQSIKGKKSNRELSGIASAGVGSGLGFLSGLVGIGGGIFLSPTLNLLGWKTPKYVAALGSVYIFFNSIGGMAGLLTTDHFIIEWGFALPLVIAVFLGGLIGSNLSASRINIHLIRGLTALLVGYAGLKLTLLYQFGIPI